MKSERYVTRPGVAVKRRAAQDARADLYRSATDEFELVGVDGDDFDTIFEPHECGLTDVQKQVLQEHVALIRRRGWFASEARALKAAFPEAFPLAITLDDLEEVLNRQEVWDRDAGAIAIRRYIAEQREREAQNESKWCKKCGWIYVS